MRRLTTLAFFAVCVGGVYGVLFVALHDSIESCAGMHDYITLSGGGGPVDLLVLVSLVLGWIATMIGERMTDVAGFRVSVLASAWCVLAIAGGLCLALILDAGTAQTIVTLSVFCSGGATVGSLLRTVLEK